MKTKTLIALSALLISSAIPVFAQTYQEEVIGRMTADNGLHKESTQDNARMVVNASSETMATLEQRHDDFRNRIHGVAFNRAEAKRGENASPDTLMTPLQRQEDFKARLYGNEPGHRI